MEGVVQTGSCRPPWAVYIDIHHGSSHHIRDSREAVTLGVWARCSDREQIQRCSWRIQRARETSGAFQDPQNASCTLAGRRQASAAQTLCSPQASLCSCPPVRVHPSRESWVQIQRWCHLSCELKILICFSKLLLYKQNEMKWFYSNTSALACHTYLIIINTDILWQFIAYKLFSHWLPHLGLPLALHVRIISRKHMKLLTFNCFCPTKMAISYGSA